MTEHDSSRMKMMRMIPALLALSVAWWAVGCSGQGTEDPTQAGMDMGTSSGESSCANGADDDGDGLTDSADPDCAAQLCVMGRVAICQDSNRQRAYRRRTNHQPSPVCVHRVLRHSVANFRVS